MILQKLVAFGENPKYLLIEINPVSLQSNQQELSVDLARYTITSHILIYTEFEILLVYGSQFIKLPFSTNFVSMLRSNETLSPSNFQRKIFNKKYNFSGRQILICDMIINWDFLYKSTTDCSLLKDKWNKYPGLCMLRFISTKLNFTFPLSNDLKSLRFCGRRGLSFPRIWFNTKMSYGSYDVIRSIKGSRVEFLSYGYDVESFATYVFTNRKHSNVTGFLKPFDKYIWICLLVG